MVKPRGYPDRRGMGAESDFISEQFVPGELHKAQQMEMARKLMQAGLSAEQVSSLLSIPLELLSDTTRRL
jgi:hypothetical protein